MSPEKFPFNHQENAGEQYDQSEEGAVKLINELLSIEDREKRLKVLRELKQSNKYSINTEVEPDTASTITEIQKWARVISKVSFDDKRSIYTQYQDSVDSIPEDLKEDKNFMLRLQLELMNNREGYPVFQNAPEALRGDRDFIRVSLTMQSRVIENIPDSSPVWEDFNFMIEMEKLQSDAIKEGVHGDIVGTIYSVYNKASEEIKQNKEFILALLKMPRSGLTPVMIPDQIREDLEVAQAIFDKYKTLKYATPEMRANRNNAITALLHNIDEFEYISNELKKDITLLDEIIALEKDGKNTWGFVGIDELTSSFWQARILDGIEFDVEKKVDTFWGRKNIITQIDTSLIAEFISRFNGKSFFNTRYQRFTEEEKTFLEGKLGKDYSVKLDSYHDLTQEAYDIVEELMKNRQIKHVVERLDPSLDRESVEKELNNLVFESK